MHATPVNCPTGAGWGGCTVSLVREAVVPQFMESVKTSYYKSRLESGHVKEDELANVFFATKPSSGAAILRFPKAFLE
jgi:N-acetylgalactosamine kinase